MRVTIPGPSFSRRHLVVRFALIGLLATTGTVAASEDRRGSANDATPSTQVGAGRLILVAGATGRTGKRVVEELLSKGYRVRGLARNVAQAKAQLPAVNRVAADLQNPGSLGAVAEGVHAIIFAVGANTSRDPSNIPEKVEYGGIVALVDRGKAAGVRNFVMMSSGGVGRADSTATAGFGGLLRWKQDAERYLRQSGLAYTIVRPGSLRDEEGGTYGIVVTQGDPEYVNLPTIARGDVAKVLVHCLFNAEANGKTFEIINAPTHAPDDWKPTLAKLKAD